MNKKARYCEGCQRIVKAEKKPVNWFSLIVLSIVTSGVYLVVYAIYRWLFMKKKYCPLCGMESVTVKEHMIKKQQEKVMKETMELKPYQTDIKNELIGGCNE